MPFCAVYGEADARDCEGISIARGGPGRNYASMTIAVEISLYIEVEEELEDALWCLNAVRIRHDGDVVVVRRICRAFEVFGLGSG